MWLWWDLVCSCTQMPGVVSGGTRPELSWLDQSSVWFLTPVQIWRKENDSMSRRYNHCVLVGCACSTEDCAQSPTTSLPITLSFQPASLGLNFLSDMGLMVAVCLTRGGRTGLRWPKETNVMIHHVNCKELCPQRSTACIYWDADSLTSMTASTLNYISLFTDSLGIVTKSLWWNRILNLNFRHLISSGK